MGITQAQKKATYKYREKYTDLRFRVTQEEKDRIKDYCNQHGESVSQFVNRLVRAEMEKEENSGSETESVDK